MKTAAVVGPGAVGTVLAADLLDAGFEVRLLARTAAQAARLRREGLRLNGRRIRGFEASRSGRRLGPCDAVFYCVKSPDLAAALASSKGIAGPFSSVLALQNGLAHIAPLRRAFGGRVVFAAAYLGAQKSEGSVVAAAPRRIELAATRGNAAHAVLLQAMLTRAGWTCRIERSERDLLWTKTLLNAAINPLGALTNLPNGELARRAALRQLLLKALEEGGRLARKKGARPAARLDRAALKLCAASAGNLNSMAQDLAAGRRTEADDILKPVLAAARDPQKEAPVLYGLYRFVKGLEGAR